MSVTDTSRRDTADNLHSTRKHADNVSSAASGLAEKATEKLDDAMNYASDVASDAMRSGREAGRQIEAVAGNFKGAVDKSVRDQPLATLAVAAMFGFVMGALWRS